MKQQILNLKKKLLLVEIGGKLSDEFVQVIDEYGIAEILGKLTDITESQFAEWVKAGSYINTFWNYVKNDNHKRNQFNTAKESFFSKLEADGLNNLDFNSTYLFQILN